MLKKKYNNLNAYLTILALSCFIILSESKKIYGQMPSKINAEYLYSDTPSVFTNFRHAFDGKKNIVTVSANLAFTAETNIEEIKLSYQWLTNYGTKINKTIPIENEHIKKDGDREFILFIQLEKSPAKQLLIFKIINKITNSINVFFIDFHPKYTLNQANLLIFDADNKPLNKSFITTNQKFKIIAMDSIANVFVSYFAKERPHTTLPFVNKSEIQKYKPDTTFRINTNKEQIFDKEGYYIFKNKENSKGITTLKVEGISYPKQVHIDEVIEPIFYLATDLELSALKSTTNSRIAFENFWLALFPDQEESKKMIKKYYERVKTANLLFTTNRKGWKEDRGMMYIIYGPPDYVYKSDRTEVWEYKKNRLTPKKVFIFKHIKDGYTRQRTVLQRSQSYESIWKQQLKQWRKGKILK